MTADVDFASATVALRPPRVAIMVADDENWREWAMTALTIASGYWGGAGFILVPFSTKTSRPAAEFADIVRAYDPDHVVSLDLPYRVIESWYPGSIGGGLSEVDRQLMIRRDHGHDHLRESEVARNEVVSWCSPMRSVRFGNDHPTRRNETVTTLRAHDATDTRFRQGFAPAPPMATEGARLAASALWRSDVGLMAAMRVGVAQKEGGAGGRRPEPTLDDLGWLIRPVDDAPESLIWNGSNIPTRRSAGLQPWFLSDQRLIQVSNSYIEDRAAVVIGDTGIDFALALAYDRLIGTSIWLPRVLLDDDTVFRRKVQPALWMVTSDLENSGAHMALTSSSVPTAYIEDLAPKITAPPLPVGIQVGRAPREETLRVGPAIVDGGYLEYVVNEHVGVSVPIPVTMTADGTTAALSGLESPTPSDLIHPLGSGWVPYWYIEVTRIDDKTPRARDLPAHVLVVEEGPIPSVNLRADRGSLTIDPRSMGFVMSGAFLPSRIGRPRLRGLSMMAWVETMAEPAGLGVCLSQPGRQAELIRRRLGTRDALLDLMTPENIKVLRAFIPRDKKPTSDERKANPEIVVLDGLDPFLTFEAMSALLGDDVHATTDLVDLLTTSRLLRRGLILDCVECGRPSFIDADRVGQTYECPQCAAINDLVSARWKEKRPEPRWFYDLYAAFRELLGSNGDVVLLAAASLRGSARSYLDAPELEFFELANGAPVAEVDIVASMNREVVLVEAKSNGTFGSRASREEKSRKLLRVANALRADRIVFATTKDAWNRTDLSHMEREGSKIAPFPVRAEEIAALGLTPDP